MRRKKEHRWVFELIRESDIVLEVVDGRFPHLTRVSSIENLTSRDKIPLIIVLNKCDLLPRKTCERNKEILIKEFPTVYISTQNRQGTKKLRTQISRLSSKKEIKISLVGIPNTGKSSLINILRGKHVTPTGQKPGVTRHKQTVRVSKRILAFDSPGVVPFDHPNLNLQAFLGAYSISNLDDPIDTFDYFLNRIRQYNPKGFIERYNLQSVEKPNEVILEIIARKRGIILKGGKLNLIEAAKIIMREFVSGTIPYWEEIPQVNT
ncbi:MAG: YlqF/YawG family GTPase [Candidatus Hodarchaeales archaeon]|jgi:ribosome biogenesis GTPase A